MPRAKARGEFVPIATEVHRAALATQETRPAEESERQRWERLAAARTQRILKALRALSRLGRRVDLYGKEDVDRMFTRIRDAVDFVEMHFSGFNPFDAERK